ncbi:hypothetical protein GCM10011581_23740 [Saccharopolyspora subtropica]|uniref:Uncharacterized protein n=1 Tax=Saccharopolyspora thermophila TaxID=89367 RepID=A0A917ND23_9PSEU|nr:hypothetical protein GCM10011581_23740 [Saccharopolyspora subtropica]
MKNSVNKPRGCPKKPFCGASATVGVLTITSSRRVLTGRRWPLVETKPAAGYVAAQWCGPPGRKTAGRTATTVHSGHTVTSGTSSPVRRQVAAITPDGHQEE